MMTRKTRDEWVAALRSGTYPQTRGVFKGVDGYCCLGVLAEVRGFLTPTTTGSHFSRLMDRDKYDDLMDLNDLVKLDFPNIAKWIEEKIPVEDPGGEDLPDV